MDASGRFGMLVAICGAALLLIAAPLLFLGGHGAGLAAPAPTPTPPAPSPSPPPTPAVTPAPSPPPASPQPSPSPPASPQPSPTPPGGAAPSPGAPVVVSVTITLAQEVPAPQAQTPRAAAGTGAVVINGPRTELGFAFTFSALSGPLQAAHFHRGAPGEAGPVVQTICGSPEPALSGASPAAANGTIAGVWRIPAALVNDLLAGRLYVNFHTALNPGGEIRGQITLAAR